METGTTKSQPTWRCCCSGG